MAILGLFFFISVFTGWLETNCGPLVWWFWSDSSNNICLLLMSVNCWCDYFLFWSQFETTSMSKLTKLTSGRFSKHSSYVHFVAGVTLTGILPTVRLESHDLWPKSIYRIFQCPKSRNNDEIFAKKASLTLTSKRMQCETNDRWY